MRIVLVTGSRDYRAAGYVGKMIGSFSPDLVVHGDCPTGADRFANEWAHGHEIPVLRFPANWKKIGDKAGPARNTDMVKVVSLMAKYGHEVYCLAFFKEGAANAGTRDCCKKLKRVDLTVVESWHE